MVSDLVINAQIQYLPLIYTITKNTAVGGVELLGGAAVCGCAPSPAHRQYKLMTSYLISSTRILAPRRNPFNLLLTISCSYKLCPPFCLISPAAIFLIHSADSTRASPSPSSALLPSAFPRAADVARLPLRAALFDCELTDRLQASIHGCSCALPVPHALD